MLVRQGFQYALRLKPQREAVLRRWVGCRRFVFNEALAHQRAEVTLGRKRPGYAALCARLPELKRLHPWLCEPPAQALQQALKDLCKAWDAKYTSHFGAPRFKKKGACDTLRLPQDCLYDAAAGLVHLPKLGAVRLRHSREAPGVLKNVTLRKKRGSANRKKAVARLNVCHGRIAAMRRDFLHQCTTDLVRSHSLIAIEDLAVKSMTASAAGTVESPGRNVKAKAGLNRTILRNGWSMARSMLEYKAAWSGVMLVAVPPAYTSQACSACGHTAAENRKAQAVFECVTCGHSENADRNAAKNILAKAQLMLGSADELLSGGRPASTPGHCGELTPVEAPLVRRKRPRSAAQGGLVELPLAGTNSGLSLLGNLHP